MATTDALTMMNVRSTMPTEQEQQFWQASYWDAVAARDCNMDGVFFYAVLTTGVYCRPSCPSRRPKPENVIFFRTREGARHAGFRACKRCKPDAASASNPNADLVEKVCRYIDAHPDGPATLETLSRAIGLSPFHLQRTFKSLTGITPRAYADSRRLQALKAGLRDGHSVTRSLYDAGYGSSSRLYERATSKLGMTPCTYLHNGKGAKITFSTFETRIGRALLAITESGVCSIQFGKSSASLEAALREEFSAAEITRRDAALAELSARLVRYIEGRELAIDFPLDIKQQHFSGLSGRLSAISREEKLKVTAKSRSK